MSRKITPRRGPHLLLSGLGWTGGMAGCLCCMVGCMGNHVEPVDARLFMPTSIPGIAEKSGPAAADSNQAAPAGDMEPGPTTLESPKSATVLPDPLAPIPAPFNTIEPIGELGSGATTQPPTTQPAAAAEAVAVQPIIPSEKPTVTLAPLPEVQGQGVYMTLGGVVAQVNDVPIYANQVLTPLKKELAAKARELDADAFRRYAEEEIYLQLRERIDDERYFATAYHSLSDEDKRLAEAHAMFDRHNKVIAAGGSVEQARQQAADAGSDFDELIKKDYRELVFVIYQRRQIEPLIQVNADNMRQFYKQNFEKLYHEKEQAQYRVIAIDPAKYKDAVAARMKIDGLRDKASKGADFGAMASTDNDNESLKELHGCPRGVGQWMAPNSYAVDAVDAAVWSLEPGQITPVIEAGGKLYIAKLEAKHGGQTHPFEDQAVQADIYAKLRQQQFNALWQQRKDASAIESMVSADAKRMQVAVEMAMQKYAQVQLAIGR